MSKRDIEELCHELNRYNRNYYNGCSEITDVEYDKKYKKLELMQSREKYIPCFSPTLRVGTTKISDFAPHTHLNNLFSLGKAQSYKELLNWAQKIEKDNTKIEYALEYKFDGITLNLTYNNGILITASTRGNGIIGEDVTVQARTIKNIPLAIPYKGLIEVHGEALMPLSSLEKYNKTVSDDNKIKNARNGVAGALRNLDSRETAKRNLVFYAYNVNYIESNEFHSQFSMLSFLYKNNFEIGKISILHSINDVIKKIKDFEASNARQDLDFLIDGIVIKVNNIGQREKIGYTSKFPKWAIAYKFEAEEFITKLKDVIWGLGKTGRYTPVAILEPVEIDGSTISRATLNNIDDIKKKRIKIGLDCIIRKSNDVIPEILGIANSQIVLGKEIKEPKYCFSCGSKLIKEGSYCVCKNSTECPEQINARLSHFVSRDAMNIKGLSSAILAQLQKKCNVKFSSDLYKLTYDDIYSLNNMKEKSTNNLLSSISKSKECHLDSFIYSLCIQNVGRRMSKSLADYYNDFDKFYNSKYEDLKNIPDIGDVVAKNIISFLKDENNRNNIDLLFSNGVKILYNKEIKKDNPFCFGKTFVITGTLNKPRKEIEKMIELNGGKITKSISKNTDFLLAGENAGSKLEKAKDLNIRVLKNLDFLKN